MNDGTTTPVWNPADPAAGTYHDFGGADRFNYAPFNLLLTPSEAQVDVRAHVIRGQRHRDACTPRVCSTIASRTNRAAPEPIFVGPGAGTGGLADTISISALNPFNPFGIDLDAEQQLRLVSRAAREVGPRLFKQDVDTWYFNLGSRARSAPTAAITGM